MAAQFAPTRLAPIGVDRRAELIAVFLLWLALAALFVWLYRDDIGRVALVDPDDWLRLSQVRDLLGGQSWHDLTQYRVNPAAGGGDVHWSRFIDVQIAGMITLFSALIGPSTGERWALALYPPLLVLPLLLLMRQILMQLRDDRLFLWLGLAMTATGLHFLHFFAPLRIDHHNWQLILSLALVWLMLGTASFWRGLAAAVVVSVHLEISLEGLPYLLLFGSVAVLEWVINPGKSARLQGFCAGMVAAPLFWTIVMRGPETALGTYCDALSMPYVMGAAVAAILILCCVRLPAAGSVTGRLLLAVASAGSGAAVFVVAAPGCLAGPFGNLTPLAHDLWYVGIAEGRPVWERPLATAFTLVATSLLGLMALLWAALRYIGSAKAADWWKVFCAATFIFALSLLILRATTTAHIILVPGFAYGAAGFLRWARDLPWAVARVPATLTALLFFPVSIFTMAAAAPLSKPPLPSQQVQPSGVCLSDDAMGRLSALPPATLFVTLDKAPEILARTHHRVYTTGHHRNHRAIDRLLKAFTADVATAKKLITASGATHVLICPGTVDISYLAEQNPGGLAAQLLAGQPPTWLRLEPAYSHAALNVYSVQRATQ